MPLRPPALPGPVPLLTAEAAQFADADKKRREIAEKLNNADAICYQGERFLTDFADKVSSDHRARIESHIRDIKSAVESKDVDAATAQAEALKQVLQQSGSAIYTAAPAEGQAPGPEPKPSADSHENRRVVDAEYQETGA